MTRLELVAAIQEIARIAKVEIDQPGDNEDRFRALKRVEKFASDILSRAA